MADACRYHTMFTPAAEGPRGRRTVVPGGAHGLKGRYSLRKAILILALAASVLGGVGASPAHAYGSFTVTGVVVSQRCLSGDFVLVTLTATATDPAAFAWDFTNNGSFDSMPSTNPTVRHVYPDETNVTARVGAINQARETDVDLVSFATLRCP